MPDRARGCVRQIGFTKLPAIPNDLMLFGAVIQIVLVQACQLVRGR
jgi:hypothetical protein